MIRKTVSLGLLWSALVMTLTGLALFIAPHGRVDRWIDWQFLGLSKSDYQALHTTFMVLFILLTMLHIYYNWHSIVLYLKNQSRVLIVATREMVIATLIATLFAAGTLLNWPPFKQIVDLGETAKGYWGRTYGEPPFGHAEEAALPQLARRTGILLSQMEEKLAAKGVRFEREWTLGQIAAANKTTPQAIYGMMKAD